MKKLISMIAAPIARRLGTLAAGTVGGMMAADPALVERVEMWASAGAFLLVDVITAYVRGNRQEVG
jgi:hypothetical protein